MGAGGDRPAHPGCGREGHLRSLRPAGYRVARIDTSRQAHRVAAALARSQSCDRHPQIIFQDRRRIGLEPACQPICPRRRSSRTTAGALTHPEGSSQRGGRLRALGRSFLAAAGNCVARSVDLRVSMRGRRHLPLPATAGRRRWGRCARGWWWHSDCLRALPALLDASFVRARHTSRVIGHWWHLLCLLAAVAAGVGYAAGPPPAVSVASSPFPRSVGSAVPAVDRLYLALAQLPCWLVAGVV